MQPEVSVIIVSWNTRRVLLDCLHSLYRQTAARLEVIVVDNASSDGSPEAVESAFPQTTVVRSGANLGFSKANNMGLQHVTGPYVLYLNPDTLVLDGAVDRMLGFMQSRPTIGVLGPHTYNADGRTTQNTVKFSPSLRRAFHTHVPLWRLIPGWTPEQSGEVAWQKTGPVQVVKGSCLLMPASLVRELGGMTERLFMYAEEDDLCARAIGRGYEVWYYADAHIIHLGGVATSQNSDAMVKAVLEANLDVFRRNNPSSSEGVFKALLLFGSAWRWLAWGVLRLFPARRERAKFRMREHAVMMRHLVRPASELP